MWKRFGLLVCCAFLVLYGLSENASALELGQSGFTNWNTSNSRVYTNDPDWWALSDSDGQGGVYRSFTSVQGGEIDYLRLCPTGSIPANSLFTFSIIAKLSNSFTNMPLSGGSDQTLLNSSYGDHGTNTYTFYTSSIIDDCVWFPVGGTRNDNLILMNSALIHVTRPTWIRITDDGGISSTDLNNQLNQIRYLQQDQYNRLVDIISNIDEANETLEDILDKIDGLSMSGSVEEGMDAANENVKDQVQDASDEAESAADDAQDTVESDTATITQQIGNVIGAITDTPATNCEINGNMGNVNLGTLNMCQGMPQEIRTRIGYITSGVLALAILRLAYSLVQAYVAYITSFTGGNDTQNGV